MGRARSRRADPGRSRANADRYLAHFRDEVVPGLRATAGYLGATVVELVVTTRWRSLQDVRHFAGPDLEAAVVLPSARSLLSSFEPRVVHYTGRYD